MSTADFYWLLDHQHHVPYTLAHADALIEQTADMVFDYTRAGALELETVAVGDRAHVRVARVLPLPEGIARTAASALTQLRTAFEHTLFAEVEYSVGRALTDAESRSIEMPATIGGADFDGWAKSRKRPALGPLRSGSPLLARIRDLQPFHRRDVDAHPLRVMAYHTNLAKHRTPSVAATRFGAVIPDGTRPSLDELDESQPITADDDIDNGPPHERVPPSIWPTVAIRRPHTGTWHAVMAELGAVEDWVRTVVVPHLVLGRSDVAPLLPRVDISVGHDSVSAALATRTDVTAQARGLMRIQAATLRESLAEMSAFVHTEPEALLLRGWLDGLADAEVSKWLDRMMSVAEQGGPTAMPRLMADLPREASVAAE